MKRFGHIAFLVVAMVMAAGCSMSKVKDITVTSVDFKYITPTSSRSLDAVLLLGIDNPAGTFSVSDLTGTVKYGDRPLVNVSGGEILLDKKSEKIYEYPCSASLVEGVSLLSLLPLMAQGNPDKLTADIKLHVATKRGLGTDLVFNDLSISKLASR